MPLKTSKTGQNLENQSGRATLESDVLQSAAIRAVGVSEDGSRDKP